MAVYFVTGKLGSGKTIVSIFKIKEALAQGRKVATNIDLNLVNLCGLYAKSPIVYRIPDKPTLPDLEMIGLGNASYDESKNGLLVLDECGTWFNSRSWSDKTRQPIINWCFHARKLGWDVYFIVQDISIVDKQAREAFAEHVVYCRRFDRLTIPFIGNLYSVFTGSKFPLPKIHMGIVKYGDLPSSLTVERWVYTGVKLYNCYDTKQVFSDNYDKSTYQLIPPYYTHGRYKKPLTWVQIMRLTKIYWRRIKSPFAFILGFTIPSLFFLF